MPLDALQLLRATFLRRALVFETTGEKRESTCRRRAANLEVIKVVRDAR
jgi:hypothetical protein